MKKIKFTEPERDAVFQIVAAVLHLGNISYKPVTIKYNNADVQAADVENPAGISLPSSLPPISHLFLVLEKAASLLTVSAADLQKAICFRRFVVKGQASTDIPLDHIKV